MAQQEEVVFRMLDNLVTELGINKIDFLKLDLEGPELEALKGAKELLDQKRINALVFEFGGCNIDSKTFLKDFLKLLVLQYGFNFYRRLLGRSLLKLSYYSEPLEQFTWQNILACVPGTIPSWKIID